MGASKAAATAAIPGGNLGVVELPFEKLKPGPGLAREEVIAHQRRRIYAALIQFIDEVGYDKVAVRALVGRSGVSTRSFYKQFDNVDDCLGCAYEEIMGQALERSAGAQKAEESWQAALRASVESLMRTFASDPPAARFALIDIYACEEARGRRIGVAFRKLEEVLAASFARAPRARPAPRHLIAGMAAGVMRIARKTAVAKRCEELPGLVDPLTDWMLSFPHRELLQLQPSTLSGAGPDRDREANPYPHPQTAQVEDLGEGERGRLLRAAAKLAVVNGFIGLTAPKIRAEAGVSRRRFDATFASVSDCFLESIAMVADRAAARAQGWALDVTDWDRRTAKAVLALATHAARDGGLARLVFTEIYATGKSGLLERDQIVARGAKAFRQTVPPEVRPSELVAEASAAAAWHIARVDFAAGRSRHLPAVAPLLTYVLLAPIVGPSRAANAAADQIRGC